MQTITMDWKLESFLVNLIDKVKVWGSGIIMLLGVIMLIVAIWQIAKGFMSPRAQTNWAMSIGCLVLGGVFLAGGYNLIADISKGAGTSLKEIGNQDSSATLGKDGEGDNSSSQKTTKTIILPFGNISAHIDMK